MGILNYLSEVTLIDERALLKFVKTAPYRYKSYEIPKRNGKGVREIAQPTKELKFLQELLVKYLEEKLPVSEAAMAYRKGKSIKDNAKAHRKNSYLLKMDFKDFFPSINPKLLFQVCSALGTEFHEQDRLLMSYALFRNKRDGEGLRLSIGAPSSPMISNAVMYLFDNEIQKLCSESDIVYTRYADDLTFSTNQQNVLFAMTDKVERILRATTFCAVVINEEKTVFASKRHNRHVTGVTLTNEGELSLGRERKRKISSLIHKFSLDLLEEDRISYLQGLMSFANQIEPEFVKRMQKKYGKEVIGKLKFGYTVSK